MLFLTIQPWLQNYIGHSYSYNLALSKAIKKNAWRFCSLIPKNCNIENLPKNWLKILAPDYLHKKKPLRKKIFTQWQNIISYFIFFKSFKKKNTCLMIEQFGLAEILVLTIYLLLFRPKIKLLLLYRYAHKDLGKKAWFYFFINKTLGFLYKKNLIFLSDSKLVANSLQSFFNQKFNVVPIPHTNCNSQPIEKDTSMLWWPGDAREDKGLKYINKLSNTLVKSSYKLFLAKSAKDHLKKNTHLCFIENNLSTENYFFYMKKAGLILLPYIPHLYHSRTSGIFVEAIIAGAIPLVFSNTWMAYELKKNNLYELIIDFEADDILNTFEEIQQNKYIRQKLQQMQTAYQKYHCIDSYSAKLKSILTLS